VSSGPVDCLILSSKTHGRLLQADSSATNKAFNPVQLQKLERKLDDIGSSFKTKQKKQLFQQAKQILMKSVQNRKLDLSVVKNKHKKNGRMLMAQLLDLIKGAKGFLNPLLMPTMIPQVSDPRITIQTFNPPNNAVLPPNLGPKVMDFNVNMPDIYTTSPDLVHNDFSIKEDMAKSRLNSQKGQK
jgi:hypothetical protein